MEREKEYEHPVQRVVFAWQATPPDVPGGCGATGRQGSCVNVSNFVCNSRYIDIKG